MAEIHNTIDMYVCENGEGCTDVGTITLHGFTLIRDTDLALLKDVAKHAHNVIQSRKANFLDNNTFPYVDLSNALENLA